jgi:putative SOS response-associated peptidase YedK
MEDIHDRMPVILDRDAETDWLAEDAQVAREALEPATDGLEVYPVSTAVNDPSNDRREVIGPSDQAGLGAFG